ncbi:hypothetical protein SUT503_08910 [Streptococcus parasuis]|nr:hypothetical protein SUT503_08910 [Streptococcus parasuis]
MLKPRGADTLVTWTSKLPDWALTFETERLPERLVVLGIERKLVPTCVDEVDELVSVTLEITDLVLALVDGFGILALVEDAVKLDVLVSVDSSERLNVLARLELSASSELLLTSSSTCKSVEDDELTTVELVELSCSEPDSVSSVTFSKVVE